MQLYIISGLCIIRGCYTGTEDNERIQKSRNLMINIDSLTTFAMESTCFFIRMVSNNLTGSKAVALPLYGHMYVNSNTEFVGM